MKTHRVILLLLTLLVGAAHGPTGGEARETNGGWAFSSHPFVDLWLHGMALVDPVGPGPHPLYDPAYPARVQREKADAAISPTPLDFRTGYFREAFRRDPAFEVFHFLPLYFVGAGRAETFRALEMLAMEPEGIPRAPSDRTALGMMAVGSVLTTPGQREVLGEFLTALSAEWNLFFQPFWQERVVASQGLERNVQELWTRTFEPVLAPLLKGLNMRSGSAILSPAIGVEGRVFGGLPQDPTDNVLVVARPLGPDGAREAVFSMLRELSFPTVRRAMEGLGGAPDSREEGERLAAVAAVRSGALILQAFLPEEAAPYMEHFLSRSSPAPTPGGSIREGFEEAYPLDAALYRALGEQINSTATTGGVG